MTCPIFLRGDMLTFSLSDLVTIFGFSSILFLFPQPVPLFPLIGAIIYTSDPLGGGFVGMVAGLFLGVPYMMLGAFLSYSSRR